MPEATEAPWTFELVILVGVFSALTWGFLVLFKPRIYQGDRDAPPAEGGEE